MRVSAAAVLLCLAGHAAGDCIGTTSQVFEDMHGGVAKLMNENFYTGEFSIEPYNSTENWVVVGQFDINCCATINVTGTSIYPQSGLLNLSMWEMQSTDETLTRLGIELAEVNEPARPKNFWVLGHWPRRSAAPKKLRGAAGVQPLQCGIYTREFGPGLVFEDIHDGDEKALKVSHKNELTIKPSGNDQSWEVKAQLDDKCIASVDFDVPGKPNPPPVPLKAQVWGMTSIAGVDKNAILFSDPSGTIADPSAILNIWAQDN